MTLLSPCELCDIFYNAFFILISGDFLYPVFDGDVSFLLSKSVVKAELDTQEPNSTVYEKVFELV